MALPTTSAEIWDHIEQWPFAVLGFVNPKGEARAAGVLYEVSDRKVYIVTGPDSWKVRHIRANPHVSMTVTIQRSPIRIKAMPPAVITFSGTATIKSLDDLEPGLRDDLLGSIADDEPDRVVIEIEPSGNFVTYGIGVSAMTMRHPQRSTARVAVS